MQIGKTHSLEPEELKELVVETERAFLSLGTVFIGIQEAEKKSLLFKRSIYVSEDIKAGDIISEKNIKVIRPALGLAPKHYDAVIGKKTKTDLKKGTPLKMEDLF